MGTKSVVKIPYVAYQVHQAIQSLYPPHFHASLGISNPFTLFARFFLVMYNLPYTFKIRRGEIIQNKDETQDARHSPRKPLWKIWGRGEIEVVMLDCLATTQAFPLFFPLFWHTCLYWADCNF